MTPLRSSVARVASELSQLFEPGRGRSAKHRRHLRVARRVRALALLALLSTLGFGVITTASPPLDGDAYEYAEVARNLVERGAALEDHARYPMYARVPLPHPAGRRLNGYAALLVPSYLVFGRSVWTLTIPFLCAYAALPYVVHRVGRRFFGSRTALCGAVLVTLHPRVIYVFGFDPMPDLLLAELLLLALCAASRGKARAFGITLGLALTLRETSVLIVVAALIAATMDSQRRAVVLRALPGLALAAVLVAPFAIRHWLTFGTPFPLEEFGESRLSADLYGPRGFDLVRVAFDWHGLPPRPTTSEGFDRWLVLVKNLESGLSGRFSGFDSYPGFPEMLGVLLSGLLVVRVLGQRSRRLPMLPLAFLVVYLSFHLVFVIHEDRYFLPVLPIAVLFGLDAAQRLSRRAPWRFLKPASLVWLLLATETAPVGVLKSLELASRRGWQPYHELLDLSVWIRSHTDPTSRFMAFPFFSTSFFTSRPTIPLPFADLRSLSEALNELRIDHLLMLREPDVTGEDLARLPCVDHAFAGRWFDLFSVDRACAATSVRANLGGLDPLYNPLAARLEAAQCGPPIGRSLAALWVRGLGVGAGLVAYCALVVSILMGAALVARPIRRRLVLVFGPWVWTAVSWFVPVAGLVVGIASLGVWRFVWRRGPAPRRHGVVPILAAGMLVVSILRVANARAIRARVGEDACIHATDPMHAAGGAASSRNDGG